MSVVANYLSADELEQMLDGKMEEILHSLRSWCARFAWIRAHWSCPPPVRSPQRPPVIRGAETSAQTPEQEDDRTENNIYAQVVSSE